MLDPTRRSNAWIANYTGFGVMLKANKAIEWMFGNKVISQNTVFYPRGGAECKTLNEAGADWGSLVN